MISDQPALATRWGKAPCAPAQSRRAETDTWQGGSSRFLRVRAARIPGHRNTGDPPPPRLISPTSSGIPPLARVALSASRIAVPAYRRWPLVFRNVRRGVRVLKSRDGPASPTFECLFDPRPRSRLCSRFWWLGGRNAACCNSLQQKECDDVFPSTMPAPAARTQIPSCRHQDWFENSPSRNMFEFACRNDSF